MRNTHFPLFLVVLVLIVGCNEVKTHIKNKYWITTISCDFESYTNSINNLSKFSTDSLTLLIDGKPSTIFSKSGISSVKVLPNFTNNLLSLTNLKEGQLIEISIWQKKGDTSAYLQGELLNTNDSILTYRTNYNKLGKSKKGWKEHFLSIPISKKMDSIAFSLYAAQKNTVFDDLKIFIYPKMPNNKITNELNLVIPKKSKKKLNRYIEKSMYKKVISEKSKKYVKGFVVKNSDTIEIKLKIKGDWSDHIFPDKPSLRIKLPNSTSFMGMTNFAIQHPKTRNYLNEWVMHKAADKTNILSTKYEFINVKINGYNMGLYAIEEHFEKHIIENRNKKEGPILKLNENGTWHYRERYHNNNLKYKYPDYQASYIDAFKLKRIKKSELLSKQYNEALKLVQLFRSGYLNIADIFDIDLLAKFYALVEISGNYHALIWHNRRFYFNPITQKLEHIYFDAIPYITQNKSIMMEILQNKNKEDNLIMDNALLMNRNFKEKYIFYINLFTSDKFFIELFEENKSDLNSYQAAILLENKNNKFSTSQYFNRIKYLRKSINSLSNFWEKQISKATNISYWMKSDVFESASTAPVIKGVSVNAYIKNDNNSYSATIENYHINDVIITGIKYDIDSNDVLVEENIELGRYDKKPKQLSLELKAKPISIYFKDKLNPTVIHKAQLIPWQKPGGKSTRMELATKFNATNNLFVTKKNNIVFSKNCIVNSLLYIPSNYNVIIEPGVTIQFKNGGGLIINNDFTCIGDSINPIKFICNDSSSHGITILKAKTVNISHTSFDGLSSLSYKNWKLTGAITIYEATAKLNNVSISNNNSEDALNIVRSNFNIINLEIYNTLSDGFDADFCTGKIVGSRFSNTGNDCIDFSGSAVNIRDIEILNSGDKGISGGEASTLTIENVAIKNAKMGIASKDGTTITATNVSVKHVNYIFSAFQKKSSYGPSKLKVIDLDQPIDKSKILVEKGSYILINNEYYKGTKMLDIENMYKGFVKP